MTQISDDARRLLGLFFPFSQKDVVTSHPPHSQLNQRRAAYDECIAKGLMVETPYNEFGAIQIRSTDEGFRIARERVIERMLENEFGLFSPEDIAEARAKLKEGHD
jgi:hypothetical protein